MPTSCFGRSVIGRCLFYLLLSCSATLVVQGQSTQTVRGLIVDAGTGAPLPGANIFLEDSDPLLGTTTDADGRFRLDGVPAGRRNFTASYLGYEQFTERDVLVTTGREPFLTIRLAASVVFSEGVEVIAVSRVDRPLNEMASVSAAQFTVEDTRRYAGGLDDPARMVSAYAGVTTGGSIQDNAIIIRGNAPKGVQWRLEGIAIPNPSHFAGLSVQGGGAVTLFSNYVLDDGDFFTGAFPAEYGNVLAGVYDISFRSGNSERREHAVQVGLLGIEGASEGPFVKGKRATYLFNYRYSTLGLLLPILPTEDVATYQDLSFKLDFPSRRWGRFEVWGLAGVDGQSMSATEDSTEWEYEVWDREDSELDIVVGTAGISHTTLLGTVGYVETTVAASTNRTTIDQRRLDDDLVLRDDVQLDNADDRLTGSTRVHLQPSARLGIRTGVSYKLLEYDLDIRARAEPDVNGKLQKLVGDTGSGGIGEGFVQGSWRMSESTTLHGGLHAIHFSLNDQTLLEPRAGLQWRLTAGDEVTLGYGRHSQVEDLRVYLLQIPQQGEGFPNLDLGMTKADHFVLGYGKKLGDNSRVKGEVYYQYLSDVPVIADSSFSMINFEQDFEFSNGLVNEGRGRNYGIDVTLDRFFGGGFYFLGTGSVFRSEYNNGAEWRSTRFDRGYAANALSGKEWALTGGNVVALNARVTLMGGKRISPVDNMASEVMREVVYDEVRAFSEREPAFFGVDVTATWQRNHRRYSEAIALQVKNALLATDYELDYNFMTGQVEEIREGFPLPVLSYRVEF